MNQIYNELKIPSNSALVTTNTPFSPTPYAESVSPTQATNYTRQRAAPLSSLHVCLYRPSNYQNDGQRRPAGRCAERPQFTRDGHRESCNTCTPTYGTTESTTINHISSHEMTFIMHDPIYIILKNSTIVKLRII